VEVLSFDTDVEMGTEAKAVECLSLDVVTSDSDIVGGFSLCSVSIATTDVSLELSDCIIFSFVTTSLFVDSWVMPVVVVVVVVVVDEDGEKRVTFSAGCEAAFSVDVCFCSNGAIVEFIGVAVDVGVLVFVETAVSSAVVEIDDEGDGVLVVWILFGGVIGGCKTVGCSAVSDRFSCVNDDNEAEDEDETVEEVEDAEGADTETELGVVLVAEDFWVAVLLATEVFVDSLGVVVVVAVVDEDEVDSEVFVFLFDGSSKRLTSSPVFGSTTRRISFFRGWSDWAGGRDG